MQVDKSASPPQFANGGILFHLELEPRQAWHTCILWVPMIGDEPVRKPPTMCSDLLGFDSEHVQARRRWVDHSTHIATSDPNVTGVIEQAVDDLASLRMHMHDELAAAGHAHDAADTDDLDAWASRLDHLGIEHSGVKQPAHTDNTMLTFRDPDNIQPEFFWRSTPRRHD